MTPDTMLRPIELRVTMTGNPRARAVRSRIREVAMRFGEYLRDQGVLSEADIEAIVDAQARTNVWFGTLAYLLGHLDFQQVGQVLEAQRQDHRLFGDLAVQHGFMTEEQVAEVADLQLRKRIKFGEMAVALQYLDRDQLAHHLVRFSRITGASSGA